MRITSIIIPICLSLLTWGIAGCTLVPALKTMTTVEQQASLNLEVYLPRSTQALREDITSLAATVSVPGFAPATSNHTVASESVRLDLKGLPAGYANVELQALNQNTPIASGSTRVLLVNGARTFIGITLNLDPAGRTRHLPFTPLTPLSSDSVNAGRLDAVITGDGAGNLPGLTLEGQLEGGNFGEMGGGSPNPQGLIRFANLKDGVYRLRYHFQTLLTADTPPTMVDFAYADPIAVCATQSAVPTASLNLAWDLRNATPSMNAQLSTRAIDFEWPEKPGVTAPDYYLEIGTLAYDPYYGILKWTAFCDLRTSATHVSYTLPETASGLIYYRLKYVAGNGTINGANYFGGSLLIPFYVQVP